MNKWKNQVEDPGAVVFGKLPFFAWYILSFLFQIFICEFDYTGNNHEEFVVEIDLSSFQNSTYNNED